MTIAMKFRGEHREAHPVNLEKLITHKLLDLSYPEQRGATRDDARAKP